MTYINENYAQNALLSNDALGKLTDVELLAIYAFGVECAEMYEVDAERALQENEGSLNTLFKYEYKSMNVGYDDATRPATQQKRLEREISKRRSSEYVMKNGVLVPGTLVYTLKDLYSFIGNWYLENREVPDIETGSIILSKDNTLIAHMQHDFQSLDFNTESYITKLKSVSDYDQADAVVIYRINATWREVIGLDEDWLNCMKYGLQWQNLRLSDCVDYCSNVFFSHLHDNLYIS